jgi:gas vesicle protein
MATIMGAVIGGIAGYFFFTDRGRELRRRFEPALDDWARELNSSRLTIEKAAGIAQESWKLLTEATNAGSNNMRNMRYPSVNQTPF